MSEEFAHGLGSGDHDAAHAATLTPPIDEVIDVQAVARLLHVGRNTVYELVGRNAIPHRRLGKQIRFSRAAVMRWLDPHGAQHERDVRR
jgi:excisionase family DNA binding protein